MSRRLLCVYQHAPTPDAPGIYRHRLLLAELVRRGWVVDLISTPVNYMTGTTDPRYAAQRYTRETIDGITHHWVWASARIHESKRRRALNYVTFATSAATRGVRLTRPDVILVSSPPLSVGAVGPVLSRRFRRPWLLEVRDVWPESAASVGWLGEDSSAYRVLERTARGLSSRAASVVVPTPGLVAPLLRHGARRVTVITGTVVDAPPDPTARAARRASIGVAESTCLFLYLGSIGVANGIDTLFDAVALLPPHTDLAIAIVGDGSARAALAKRLAREPLPGVHLVGAVARAEVGSWLSASDVCLHLLRPDPVFATALPTKLLEYFGAHRPFVTTVPGLPQRIAERSGGSCAVGAEALAGELAGWTAMAPQERHAHGEVSFRFGTDRFGLEPVVDRLERVLVDAIDAHGSHEHLDAMDIA